MMETFILLSKQEYCGFHYEHLYLFPLVGLKHQMIITICGVIILRSQRTRLSVSRIIEIFHLSSLLHVMITYKRNLSILSFTSTFNLKWIIILLIIVNSQPSRSPSPTDMPKEHSKFSSNYVPFYMRKFRQFQVLFTW